ncbi:hypothetical protein [Streptomyces sp. Root264]|uniref:hypothetical protein n=1 Tax=Streptomyces sp. Root264 TaxID=1736503 RepID=UPI000AE3F4FD|nr:hypothetical protein [Streptomyces sp. Root264]
MTASPTASQAGNRPTALWAASLASLTAAVASWALCWLNAYVVHDDLPNSCGDLRRQTFPPEVACAYADGTLTGANADWIEVVFFASLVAFLLLTGMMLALVVLRRK